MSNLAQQTPELAVSQWFNTPKPLTLSQLRGRPVFLHAFQLLCPGCVSEALPQVKRIEKTFGRTDLQIIGLLRVMFDPRITLQAQVSAQLKDHFGDKVFDTVIPRNVRLAEAPSYGQPGVVFDPNARGSQAFLEFAREMVRRVQVGLNAKSAPSA